MNFLAILLRILSLPVAIIGYFTCVILIGFALIALAKDMNVLADKLQYGV